jgi:hypothetical protein
MFTSPGLRVEEDAVSDGTVCAGAEGCVPAVAEVEI